MTNVTPTARPHGAQQPLRERWRRAERKATRQEAASMTRAELPDKIRELAQAARTLASLFATFAQPEVLAALGTMPPLEDTISRLQRLAEKAEALASIAEAE